MKPSHWSNTQQNMFERCALQYYYRYGERLKVPPDLGLIRGRAVHSAAEKVLKRTWSNQPVTSADEVRALAGSAFDEAAKEEWTPGDYYGGSETPESMKRARIAARADTESAAVRYYSHVGKLLSPMTVEVVGEGGGVEAAAAVELEVTLDRAVRDVDVMGIVDLVDSGAIIRDLKTAGRMPTDGAQHADQQLTFYYWLVGAFLGQEMPKLALDVVVVPRGEHTFHTERQPIHVERLKERIDGALRSVEAEIWVPTSAKNWWCSAKWCGYYAEICPHGARGRARPET